MGAAADGKNIIIFADADQSYKGGIAFANASPQD